MRLALFAPALWCVRLLRFWGAELRTGDLLDVLNERLDLFRGQTAGNLASRQRLAFHCASLPCMDACVKPAAWTEWEP